ncbi:hypothetical protein PQX77_002617 [Marasmius sp. AFHP31]|nr:hypothetical protein PQX77_002617 [Marasmius sp. AFHP31]
MMRTTFSVTFALVALNPFVHAQGQTNSGCSAALANAASNPDAAACFNPNLISGMLNSTGTGQASLVSQFNEWLTSVCSAPACSQDTLRNVYQNVWTACNLDSDDPNDDRDRDDDRDDDDARDDARDADRRVAEYGTFRKLACLRDTNNFCATSALNATQPRSGAVTLGWIFEEIEDFYHLDDQDRLQRDFSCTPCMKAAYNIVKADRPSEFDSDDERDLRAVCGDSFTDGANPDGISQSQSTGGNDTTGGNGQQSGTGNTTNSDNGNTSGTGGNASGVDSSSGNSALGLMPSWMSAIFTLGIVSLFVL